MTQSAVELVEYTDPGCSWAWGTEPKLRLLRWRHGERIRWRRVMGGLVPDLTRTIPDFDPFRGVPKRIEYWRAVTQETRMPYPARLQYQIQTTETAGSAVKAAELQGDDVAGRVLRRLRESTYVFGTPPNGEDAILDSVRGVVGLDADRLAKDIASEAVAEAFRADWEETRNPDPYVLDLDESPAVGGGRAKQDGDRWRYVFPTVVVRGPAGHVVVPGWKPYERYVDAMESVAPGSTGGARPDPSAEEAFATWSTLAPLELETLCGLSDPPAGVDTHDWGDGVFYMTRAEAASRRL